MDGDREPRPDLDEVLARLESEGVRRFQRCGPDALLAYIPIPPPEDDETDDAADDSHA